MSRSVVLRELARDNMGRILVVVYPIAIATQFIGNRHPLDITVSLVFIAVSLVLVTRALYRDAANRVEDRILAAENAQLDRQYAEIDAEVASRRPDKHAA